MSQRSIATGAASFNGRSNQQLILCLLLLCPAGYYASAVADGPVGGQPFTMELPLQVLPSTDADSSDAAMQVTRLIHKKHLDQDNQPASACDMGDAADKKKCLSVERGCMWTTMTTRDPLKRVQAITSYCMPCELDGTDIPCWNPGAWYEGKQVLECAMSCIHQQRIWQPQYACSDTTGYISQSQCFDRAAKSGSKCMFISYKDKDGQPRASCGPCELSGTGGWGCPPNGGQGPVDGSTVTSCLSQCDVICAGPPACPPTVAPPPPPPLQQSPGLPDTSSPADKMVTAPVPWLPLPAPDPMAIIEAARNAAKKAGWKIAPPPPLPKVYWPVVYYQSPADFLYTTGPPPVEGPEPPLPVGAALLQYTGPPPVPPPPPPASIGSSALLQEAENQPDARRTPREPFLRQLRRRSFGQ